MGLGAAAFLAVILTRGPAFPAAAAADFLATGFFAAAGFFTTWFVPTGFLPAALRDRAAAAAAGAAFSFSCAAGSDARRAPASAVVVGGSLHRGRSVWGLV